LIRHPPKVADTISTTVEGDKNTTVTISITGDDCAWPTFGPNCITGVPLTGNFTFDFKTGEQDQYFYYDAPTYDDRTVASLKFSASAAGGGSVDAEDILLYARYLGTPSSKVYDGVDANGTVTVDSPRRGMWVFYVHAIATGTYDFQIDEHVCEPRMAGPSCNIPVEDAFNNMTLTITMDKGSKYILFRTAADQGLVVSATTSNSSNIPFIYASRWQIPVVTDKGITADVMNCNRNYCSVVRSIAHNSTGEDWYIIVEGSSGENVTYGLWFNTTCVPDCATENHGDCLDSGKCMCEIDYEGIDCSVSKGLGPQYIVLIIIASLVVASAIIGFVAWAYMRRKRANYEIVS